MILDRIQPLGKIWDFLLEMLLAVFLITCAFKHFPLLTSRSRVKLAPVSAGEGQKPNVCERKSYKIDRRRNFYLENILWLKIFACNFLHWTVCNLFYGQKKSYSFMLEYNFPLLGENSTYLIKTWWVIARLPASSLMALGYYQLAALVPLLGSRQAAAEQTLHRGVLYLPHTSHLWDQQEGKRGN